MKQKLAIVGVFLTAVALILFFATKSKAPPAGGEDAPQKGGDPQAKPLVAPDSKPEQITEISFVYSTEKQDWIQNAVAGFSQVQPGIKVTLIGKGSLEASAAILDGTLAPTLYSPADSLIANLLADDWTTKTGAKLYESDPAPLLLSPLVFAVWKDRADALTAKTDGVLTWKAIREAVISPKGWPAVGGKSSWGFVKLGQTDPTRSNSGLQALLSMSLEYYGKTSGLTVEDLLDEKYQRWIKDLERAVGKFEASTGTFMTDMIRFGPSKYDIALVYESLAVSQLENAQGRWGSLRLYYPPTTLWSDHPVMLLETKALTAAQREAGKLLVAYLRSTPVQSSALRFGFRPADPSVPMKVTEGPDPFAKLAQYGLSLELPAAAPAPDGAVVRNLLTMWSRVMAK
ncbi:MAG: substrate-binding domain-containing protein [Myxococcales bacterium]|nr:substrate-binding domain-containing protein [Myxococcales bacterium]